MDFEISKRFVLDDVPESPEISTRDEFIKLAVSSLSYSEGVVSLKFHIAYMFPNSLTVRYHDVYKGLVLVVSDVDQQDCFSTNFTSDAYVPAPGTALRSNLITAAPPSLPMPSKKELEVMDGGWINGDLSFRSPNPRSRPNIFMHVVIENYTSNCVGLDLYDRKPIYY
jgi:hypothetical protein